MSMKEKLESLFDFAESLGCQNDFSEIVRLIVQKSLTLIEADASALLIINPRTRDTVKTIFKKEPHSENRKYQTIHTSVSGWVIKHNESFFSQDIRSDERLNRSLFKNRPVKSVICVPLRMENMVIGTLILSGKQEDQPFSTDDLNLVEKFAAVVSPFLRNVMQLQDYFSCPIPDSTLLKKYQAHGLLGKSVKFIELLKAVDAASRCDVRVLLVGETGTGKELIAKAIHRLSSRTQNKFVAIDCGAIPANLIESELFGYVKGAFTGADRDRLGLLDEANGGTLFMDEIANLPMEMQTKLMRFLQEGEFRPIGSNRMHKVDARVISASSSSLEKMVTEKKFRPDLFYRLNVYPIPVPGLNARRQDIAILANHFLEKCANQQKKAITSFHEEILDYLKNRTWIGNIRELENIVERLVTVTPADVTVIIPNHLPTDLQKEFNKIAQSEKQYNNETSLALKVADFEEKQIRQCLAQHNWNQSQSARVLKISEHTLRYKMKKLKIVRPS
ncbi:MAG: sigma 54-interacting transcriptional regulator [bacterium]